MDIEDENVLRALLKKTSDNIVNGFLKVDHATIDGELSLDEWQDSLIVLIGTYLGIVGCVHALGLFNKMGAEIGRHGAAIAKTVEQPLDEIKQAALARCPRVAKMLSKLG
jgi:hypothetical protein